MLFPPQLKGRRPFATIPCEITIHQAPFFWNHACRWNGQSARHYTDQRLPDQPKARTQRSYQPRQILGGRKDKDVRKEQVCKMLRFFNY